MIDQLLGQSSKAEAMLASYDHVTMCEAATAAATETCQYRLEADAALARVQERSVVWFAHTKRRCRVAIGFERWAGMVKGLGGSEKRRARAAMEQARTIAGVARWSRQAVTTASVSRLHQIGQVLAAVLLMEACSGWLHRRQSVCRLLERWRLGSQHGAIEAEMDMLRWEHAEKEFELQHRIAQWENLVVKRRTHAMGTDGHPHDENRGNGSHCSSRTRATRPTAFSKRTYA